VIACGGPSLGLAAKLSNNHLSGIITIACAEAMDMGMRAGMDARVLASVFAAGTAQNAICDVFNPVPGVCPQAPSSSGYRGGLKVQLMRKDIGLAVDMAGLQGGVSLSWTHRGLGTHRQVGRTRNMTARVEIAAHLGQMRLLASLSIPMVGPSRKHLSSCEDKSTWV
jgi:3-hydroxyisobutyrate dehydrogenase-like beta-hydroxyacid dehydrogenase